MHPFIHALVRSVCRSFNFRPSRRHWATLAATAFHLCLGIWRTFTSGSGSPSQLTELQGAACTICRSSVVTCWPILEMASVVLGLRWHSLLASTLCECLEKPIEQWKPLMTHNPSIYPSLYCKRQFKVSQIAKRNYQVWFKYVINEDCRQKHQTPLHLQVVQSPPSSSWPSSWSRCHHLGSQGGWGVQGFVKVPVVGRPTRASSKLNILRISFDLTSADSIKVARQSQTHIFAHPCVFGLKCNQKKANKKSVLVSTSFSHPLEICIWTVGCWRLPMAASRRPLCCGLDIQIRGLCCLWLSNSNKSSTSRSFTRSVNPRPEKSGTMHVSTHRSEDWWIEYVDKLHLYYDTCMNLLQ